MYTTYQAKIIKPDGLPLDSATVNFRFTILDPAGSCILYTENFNAINMSNTAGLIQFSLGSGIKTYPVSASVQFSDIFNNHGAPLACASGGFPPYAPATSDVRKVVMQFNDGNGWQTLPAMSINHVPYAMYSRNAASATVAANSLRLNGKSDSDFVQYTTIPTCSASNALQFNGATFGCVPVGGGGGGSGGSVSVSGTSPVMVTGPASAPVISISVASMSTDGYLTAADYAEFKAKLSVSSTQITNTLGYAPVSSSAVASQIDAAATVSATAHSLVKRDASGNGLFSGISAGTANLNYVDIYRPSTSFNIRLQASSSLTSNYVLTLPATSGTAGQVLSTDGAGTLSWVNNGSGGSVTSVSGTASEITSTGGSAPALGLANVGTAGTYYKVITDAKGRVTSGATTLTLSDLPNTLLSTTSNFAGDISGIISNITVNRLQGVSVTVSSLTTNDILQFDGSKYVNKNIPTCSAGQYISYNGTSFVCNADAGASGTIASLSVTSPISSTGGPNPTISISQASGSSNGYLSSGDWTTFNNKITSSAASIAEVLGFTPAASGSVASYWIKTGSNVAYSAGSVGIGTGVSAPFNVLEVSDTQADTDPNMNPGTLAIHNKDNTNGNYVFMGFRSNTTTNQNRIAVKIGAQVTARTASAITGDFVVSPFANGVVNEQFRVTSAGRVGIGTSTPVTTLDVTGGLRIGAEAATCDSTYAGTIRYNGGLVQYCNGTTWSSFGVAGAGITNLNGSTSGSQTFANSLTGTAPAFATLNGVHTLNIPFASAGTTTAGLISNSDFVTFSNKLTSSTAAVTQALGYTPANSSTVATLNTNLNSVSSTLNTAQSNIAAVSAAVTSLAAIEAASYTSLMNGKITSSAASIAQVLGYTPAASGSVSSQWINSGTTIRYMSGNVGIGVSNPSQALDVVGTVSASRFLAVDGNNTAPSFSFSGQTGTGFYRYSGNTMAITNGGSLWARLDGSLGFYGNNTGHFQISPSGSTAAAPTYTFFGDSTTGMYRAAASSLGFSTGSAERMRITASGAVGIGTNSPTSQFAVTDPVSTGRKVWINDYSREMFNVESDEQGFTGMAVTNTHGSTRGYAMAALSNTGSWGTAKSFAIIDQNAGNTRMVIDPNGQVGVGGAIVPGYPLHVYWDQNAFKQTVMENPNAGTNAVAGFTALSNNGGMNMGMTSTAGGGFGYLSTGGNGGLQLQAFHGSGEIIFKTSAGFNERMRITATGRVGIGTSSPVTALAVSGGLRISMESAACAVSYAGTLRYNSGSVEYCNGTAWTAFDAGGSGITSSAASVAQVLGYTPANSATVTTFTNSTVASFTSITNTKVTSSAASIAQVLGYTPMASGSVVSSQWNTSGTTINYTAGNVGIGTAAPNTRLHISESLNGLLTAKVQNTSTGAGAASRLQLGYGNNADLMISTYGQNYGTGTLLGLPGNGASWTEIATYTTSVGLGIGTAASAPITFTTNGAERIRIASNGYVGIGVSAPSEVLEVSGSVKATSFISTSDRRLKQNIQSIEGLNAISKLNGYSYQWKSNGQYDAGVIAQELEEVFPHAVVTDSRTGLKAVKYMYLIAPLINSTKELHGICEANKKDVDNMKRELASVKEENQKLKDKTSELENQNSELQKRLRLIEKKLGLK